MMKKNLLYILLFLSGFQPVVFAQSSVNARKAAVFFRNGEKEYASQRYTYAIPFLSASLQYNGNYDSLALLHIAESYWYTRNYDSAFVFYQAFENKYGPLFSSSQHLAELYANKGDYAKAAAIYKRLSKEIPPRAPDLINRREQGFSDINPFLRDSLDYAVRLLKLNSLQQDFSPQYYQHGMVFVSNRYSKKTAEKEFGWDGLPFANIYWVKDTADLYTTDSIPGYANRLNGNRTIKINDDYTAQTSNDNDIILVSGRRSSFNGTIDRLDKFSNELNTKYNYGPLCFNKAGTKLYFTRNNLSPNNGRYNLEICEASYENGHWTKIRVMPFVNPAYDYYHPALSDDEQTLYFCSNKPDGLGGSDIYYVGLNTDKESVPAVFNLDNRINTAGNELFPTIIGDTLYFSSDGFAGLGGLDIYKVSLKRGATKKPVNLGYPVNSSFDDFGIVYNPAKTKGFFTSNRLGTDDIYVFDHEVFSVMLAGNVLNKATMRRLDSVQVVIKTVDQGMRNPVDSVVTNLTGNYQFPVHPSRAYVLALSRPGFFPDSVLVTNTGTLHKLLLEPVLLRPIPPPPVPQEADRDKDSVPDSKDKCPDVKGTKANAGCPDIQARLNELAKMVFFKTASSDLSPAALKPLNEIADIIKDLPNVTLRIEGHTDNRASAAYNKGLSDRRAKSVMDFLVKKGFAPSRFSAEGFGLERPIADNNTEEGRALNRRVTIVATFH